MHPLATNMTTPTRDVHRFGFEPAGALEIADEYSGLAVASAHLYCFRRSQACMPHTFNLAHWWDVMNEDIFSQYTACIGLDWADKKHDVCVQFAESGEREFSVVNHNAAALDEWVKGLRKRFGGLIAVAVELSKGPIISVLQRYYFVVIFPINAAVPFWNSLSICHPKAPPVFTFLDIRR